MMKQLNQYLGRVGVWCEGYLDFVIVMTLLFRQEFMTMLFGQHTVSRQYAERAQVDTIITLVIIGVVALVGVLIYSQVEGSLGSTLDVQGARDDPANATTLENSSAAVGDGFGDAIDLIPIVLIVLVAALVIGAVQRFRS